MTEGGDGLGVSLDEPNESWQGTAPGPQHMVYLLQLTVSTPNPDIYNMPGDTFQDVYDCIHIFPAFPTVPKPSFPSLNVETRSSMQPQARGIMNGQPPSGMGLLNIEMTNNHAE